MSLLAIALASLSVDLRYVRSELFMVECDAALKAGLWLDCRDGAVHARREEAALEGAVACGGTVKDGQ